MEIEFETQNENQGFTIDNDSMADWALRRIAERREECERICSIAVSQIAAMQARIDEEHEKLERDTAFLTGKLHEYFATVKHRETKTSEKYKLLSGELVLAKAKMKPIVSDQQELISFLEENGMEDFIKVKKEAAWGDLKKQLDFSTGQAVDVTTGEVVPGVEVEEVEPVFKVEV